MCGVLLFSPAGFRICQLPTPSHPCLHTRSVFSELIFLLPHLSHGIRQPTAHAPKIQVRAAPPERGVLRGKLRPQLRRLSGPTSMGWATPAQPGIPIFLPPAVSSRPSRQPSVHAGAVGSAPRLSQTQEPPAPRQRAGALEGCARSGHCALQPRRAACPHSHGTLAE